MSHCVQEMDTLPFAESLTNSERASLRGRVRLQQLRSRQALIQEDAPFAGLHVVKTGNLKLCRSSRDKEQILEIIGPGDVVDPIPLFDDGVYAVTAKAMTPCEIYCFPPDVVRKLIAENPILLNQLLHIVSMRLRKLAALANDLAFKDVTARVCRVLLEQSRADAESNPSALMRPLTRQELASMVGTAREVAWRALKGLERDGLIEIHGQHITILDAAALASRT
jgi:CRP/FNR family transcriptional regulator